ncbi:MAG TPA: STAS/SEC14 domain-containing protein [Thermoanaerobaculia bacterium]
MIERLEESGEKGVGFKVTGRVTAEEVEAFLPQIEFAIKDRGKRTIGILADLSAMTGADWAARWEEIKFLSKYAEHIERVAVVGAGKWEDVKAEILAGTVLIQAETRYYPSAEIQHAWHWVKTGDAGIAPGRTILPKGSLMANYVPEYNEV